MGSFPGFEISNRIFTSWVNVLRTQSTTWNDFWDKLKGGDVQFGDWAKAMAGSVEALTSFSEQVWLTLWGPGAPPWVNLSFPPKSPVPVRVYRAVSKDDPIDSVPLTLLGGHQKGPALDIHVDVTGPYELALLVDDATWKKFEPQPGQYVGVVFSPQYADPIAIISFRVSAEDVERWKAAPDKLQELGVLNENARSG